MQRVRNVLRRKNRVIAGVAGGLADFFGLDVSLVRLMFILSLLFGGSGLFLYIVLWIVMPKEGRMREMDMAHAVMV
ncbi:PspC domain-containing protein [Chloroflexi bacterium TSY]|nr:PspC domain-containing protein [Chloroflexi bacterium TSY]